MAKIDFERISFLVVEDNTHMRRIVRTLLHAFGSRQVYEAEDGAAGLEAVEQHAPDILITDWVMPILDGAELVRLIRNPDGSNFAYMPIIMLTAYSEKKRVIEARDFGVNEFLCKPISAKALYQRVHNLVANPRPFIKARGYFGPDRRRHVNSRYAGPERRLAEATDVKEVGTPEYPSIPNSAQVVL